MKRHMTAAIDRQELEDQLTERDAKIEHLQACLFRMGNELTEKGQAILAHARDLRAQKKQIGELAACIGNLSQRLHELEHPPVTFASENGRLLGDGYRPGYPAGMTSDECLAEASDGRDTPCGHCGRTGRQAMRPYLRAEDGSYTRLFTCPHCGHTEEG